MSWRQSVYTRLLAARPEFSFLTGLNVGSMGHPIGVGERDVAAGDGHARNYSSMIRFLFASKKR
jgi:hypothetical protein